MSLLSDIAEENNSSEDEIQKALDIISADLEEVEKKEIIPIEEEKKLDIDFRKVTNIILDKINKIDADQDEIHEHFFGEMMRGKDHSESSKVLVAEIHKTKADNVKSLVELVKAYSKLEASRNNPKSGVMVVTKSAEDVGINFSNFD